MVSPNDKNKKIAIRAMLLGLAIILAWVEVQIPPLMAVPGMKIGLTNMVVLFALYRLGEKDGIIINVLRIILVSIIFGNGFAFLYSLAGGLLSGFTMIVMKRFKCFGIVSVSVAGGIFHNVGQIIVAMLVLETGAVFYYLPYLWVSGIAAGAAVGFLSAVLIKRIPEWF